MALQSEKASKIIRRLCSYHADNDFIFCVQ
jgi:hypothetical protein